MKAWLRFFRVVNLPTVPGDVWVGLVAFWSGAGILLDTGVPVLWATLASCCAYLYGLADNDIVGAVTDRGRPIPDGEISLGAARVARAVCWALVLVFGSVPDPISKTRLPVEWWFVMLSLFLAMSIYNRTKAWWLMGLCRGLNVLTGGAVAYAVWKVCLNRQDALPACALSLGAVVLIWTVYVAWVTKYSEGEETDPARKRRVGFLIGAIVYLQMTALLVFHSGLVVVVAVLLVLMRILQRLLPKVSAS